MKFKRIEGVTVTILQSWCQRDYGLSWTELRVVIELRNGVCPEWTGSRLAGARDLYLSRVIALLPELAKPRCKVRAASYALQLALYMFPPAGIVK